MHILILPAISSWRMLARCFTSRFWRLGNPGARRSKAPGNLEHLENLENLLKPNEPLPSSKLLLLLKGFKVLSKIGYAREVLAQRSAPTTRPVGYSPPMGLIL
jgi:hypothetical protein